MDFWLVSLGFLSQIIGGSLEILAVALNNIATKDMTECQYIGTARIKNHAQHNR
tara:strand:- start:4394 stop:4555 length:162 start_codon:yes stop_codon:yes gene_type:complete